MSDTRMSESEREAISAIMGNISEALLALSEAFKKGNPDSIQQLEIAKARLAECADIARQQAESLQPKH